MCTMVHGVTVLEYYLPMVLLFMVSNLATSHHSNPLVSHLHMYPANLSLRGDSWDFCVFVKTLMHLNPCLMDLPALSTSYYPACQTRAYTNFMALIHGFLHAKPIPRYIPQNTLTNMGLYLYTRSY